MESIIFNQKSLDSTFIIDPIQNDEFSFGQVFSTVKELNVKGLSHSRKQKCLIISSSPYFKMLGTYQYSCCDFTKFKRRRL